MKTCDECGRARKPADFDYTPIQVIFGQPLGWFSGKDEEMCGECMTNIIKNQ